MRFQFGQHQLVFAPGVIRNSLSPAICLGVDDSPQLFHQPERVFILSLKPVHGLFEKFAVVAGHVSVANEKSRKSHG